MTSRNMDEIINKMTNEDVLRIFDFTERCVANLFGRSCGKTAMRLCKKAVYKQIPKDVICDKDIKLPHAFCPSCNRLFKPDEPDWGCKHCQTCGQALKWGDKDGKRRGTQDEEE